MSFLRSLDPKLVATVVTAALVRLGTEVFGIAESDPLLQGVIALAVGAVVGWLWPNDGTVLRTEQEDGNPDPSKLKQAGYGVVELLVAVILLILLVWLVFALVPDDGDAAVPCHVGKGVPSAQPIPSSPIGKGYRP